MTEKIREEVINVVLAQSLRNKGLDLVIPETIGKRRWQDVIVELYGLRLLIEGRKEHLKKGLFKDIEEKLEDGYGDIGIAILYPNKLYKVKEIGELEKKIEKSRFSGAVFYWSAEGIKYVSFHNKEVRNIVEVIREILNIYVKNDILKQQIEEVRNSIEKIVKDVNIPTLWLSDKELLSKLMIALGVSDYGKEEKSHS